MVKESKVFTVLMWPSSGSYIVVLEEIPGVRLLLIWIGKSEAEAIALKLQKTELPRPLTHDLLKTLIDKVGYRLDRVIINDLRNDTYYAKVILRNDGREIEIDSRPSDAIALAVRSESKIYIEESVLERGATVNKPITQSEVNQFKEKLKDLRPEDFFSGEGGKE
ncbi:MAG: bifunctional nuclease family protein [Candidatus Omnitrophica bacterium]|nr:bifunctional nuclease family protein [Candidatus Omnitrophota bacterium]